MVQNEAVLLSEPIDRDFLLSMLNTTIMELHTKFTKGRIKDATNENIKVSQARAIIYGCNVAEAIYKDKQLDVLQKKLDELTYAINNPARKELTVQDKAEVDEVIAKIDKIEG